MKKRFFILSILIIILSITFLSQPTWAFKFSDVKGFYQTTAQKAGYVIAGQTKFHYSILIATVKTLMTFAGVIFAALFFYAGLMWLTAAGNEEKIGKARKTMSYAVLGVVIVAGAYTIATMISSAITSGPVIPTETQPKTPGQGSSGLKCTEDANEFGPPGTCKAANLCLMEEGYLQDITPDCGNEICCRKVTAPAKCSDCGKTGICDKTECENIKNELGRCCYKLYTIPRCKFVDISNLEQNSQCP